MSSGRLQGCSRGIYGLSSWDPPRLPHQEMLKDLGIIFRHNSSADFRLEPSTEEQSVKLHLPVSLKRLPMVVKYPYTANVDSPLGHELSVKKDDILNYLKSHEDNENWWLAENINGEIGYVPMSYMLMLEERNVEPSWTGQICDRQKEQNDSNVFGIRQKAVSRSYEPTYEQHGTEPMKQYYCETCCKEFNGPKPFCNHMMSKGHKEEVERQEICQQ